MTKLLPLTLMAAIGLCLAGCGDSDSPEAYKKDADKQLASLEQQLDKLAADAGATDLVAKAKITAAKGTVSSLRAKVNSLDVSAEQAKFEAAKTEIDKAIAELKTKVDELAK